jgi:hypothetical protein
MSLFLTVLKAVWCWGEMEGGGVTQINRDVGIALGLLRKGEVASDMSPNQGRLVHFFHNSPPILFTSVRGNMVSPRGGNINY